MIFVAMQDHSMDAKLVDSELIRLRKQILNMAAELRRLPEETTSQLIGEFNQHAMPDSCFADLRIAALFPQENPNPVIRLAMDGRLLFSNRAAEPLLSADCLQNQAVPSFFAQIDLAFSQTKPIQQLEYHAEGRVYTLDVVPVAEHNCINVYGRDITHQKQVESTREQLLAENSRQQALLDAIFETEPSGLAVIAGSDLRFVYANSAYRFLCPPANGDPIGHTYDDVWAGILPETYTSQVREALETGRPFLIKGFERRFPDGTTRIFTLQIRRLQWGREPAALLILWDTTELTLSETRYRDLADSITDNFVAYDQNLRCVFRNNSSTMYSHIAPSAMVGKSFEELFPGMVGGALHKAYLQVLSDHQLSLIHI
jgi:PAS domain-containing protein